jgi:FkbM family methyltransferase
MMNIAIIDLIGLEYDGSTVQHKGLGGSESAVVYLSKELSKIGCNVTVFNNVKEPWLDETGETSVVYAPWKTIEDIKEKVFDVVISSRTCIPFLRNDLGHPSKMTWNGVEYEVGLFNDIVENSKFKAVWLHDTFCVAEQFLEELVVEKHIDRIFTLSDFHTTYVTNSTHGQRRNYEVLKNSIWQTRNGVNPHDTLDDVEKDRNHFVYNASVSKGLGVLLEDIWPRVKELIPDAYLTVIGGYYNMGQPDEQEKQWVLYSTDSRYQKLAVNFTGVITQYEIARILKTAGFTIYPCAFPETSGISTLESLYYNTPVITCRFGALGETALKAGSYMIDYPVVPNDLFPHIRKGWQVQKFIDTVYRAYDDIYGWKLKVGACSQIKGLVEWDKIALEWKAFLYKELDRYLPVDEYRRLQRTSVLVDKVFERRISEPSSRLEHYRKEETMINVVCAVRNARDYIADCIMSVATQDYDNWKMFITDDASDDGTAEIIKDTIASLPEDLQNRFKFEVNDTRRGSLDNQVYMMYECYGGLIMLLDGDDKLIPDNQIFNRYNTDFHEDKLEFSYGSCWSLADKVPLVAQEYPNDVKEDCSYRRYQHAWGIPYTHLRVFTVDLYDRINREHLKIDKKYPMVGGDVELFYQLLEQADPYKIRAYPHITTYYNDLNPLNDYKVNPVEQNLVRDKSIGQTSVPDERILIAIPTAKYIEPETFKSIYDLKIPAGYKADFQYFFGYRVDQVRNLIASHSIDQYDYIFFVDSDISFPPDTLIRLIAGLDDYTGAIGGLYVQRNEENQVEASREGNRFSFSAEPGVYRDMDWLGFGCCLVDVNAVKSIKYPWFEYHPAIDHANTISEDADFCQKLRAAGWQIVLDTRIVCDHHGAKVYRPTKPTPAIIPHTSDPAVLERLIELGNQRLLPNNHRLYLEKMKEQYPDIKTIFDIGACVLHWTNEAARVWPDAEFYAFEAMNEVNPIYDENIRVSGYFTGKLLGEEARSNVPFWKNLAHPGGNSRYRENINVNPEAEDYFPDNSMCMMEMVTLDWLCGDILKPDLIKMDVQGSELAILKGAVNILKSCNHLILELQHTEYNTGAPMGAEVMIWLDQNGFRLKDVINTELHDADYHFIRK